MAGLKTSSWVWSTLRNWLRMVSGRMLSGSTLTASEKKPGWGELLPPGWGGCGCGPTGDMGATAVVWRAWQRYSWCRTVLGSAVSLTKRTLLATASTIWGWGQSCETLEHWLDGALVWVSMAKVQSGSMLGGRSSSRYFPGRTTVVGADERNT